MSRVPSLSVMLEIQEKHKEILSEFPALRNSERIQDIESIYSRFFEKLLALKKNCNPLKLQDEALSTIYFNQNRFLLSNQTKFLSKWENPFNEVSQTIESLKKLPETLTLVSTRESFPFSLLFISKQLQNEKINEAIRDQKDHEHLGDFFSAESIIPWSQEWVKNGQNLQGLIKETEELFVKGINDVFSEIQKDSSPSNQKIQMEIEKLEEEIKMRQFEGYFGHLRASVSSKSKEEVENTIKIFRQLLEDELVSFEKKAEKIELECSLISKQKEEKIQRVIQEVATRQIDLIKIIQAKTKMMDKLFKLFGKVGVYLSVILDFPSTFKVIKVELFRRIATKDFILKGTSIIKEVAEKEVDQRRQFQEKLRGKIPEGCYPMLKRTFEPFLSAFASFESSLETDMPFSLDSFKDESEIHGLDFSDTSSVSSFEEDLPALALDHKKGVSYQSCSSESVFNLVEAPPSSAGAQTRNPVRDCLPEYTKVLMRIEKAVESNTRFGGSLPGNFKDKLRAQSTKITNEVLKNMSFFKKFQELSEFDFSRKTKELSKALEENERKTKKIEKDLELLKNKAKGKEALCQKCQMLQEENSKLKEINEQNERENNERKHKLKEVLEELQETREKLEEFQMKSGEDFRKLEMAYNEQRTRNESLTQEVEKAKSSQEITRKLSEEQKKLLQSANESIQKMAEKSQKAEKSKEKVELELQKQKKEAEMLKTRVSDLLKETESLNELKKEAEMLKGNLTKADILKESLSESISILQSEQSSLEINYRMAQETMVKFKNVENRDRVVLLAGPNSTGIALTGPEKPGDEFNCLYITRNPPKSCIESGMCIVEITEIKYLAMDSKDKEIKGVLELFEMSPSLLVAHINVKEINWPTVFNRVLPKQSSSVESFYPILSS